IVAPIVDIFFLVLIFVSLFKKSKEVVFFTIVLIISLWAALAKNFPIDIYKVFYLIIPGLNSIKYTWRFIIISNLALPVLASLGLTYIFQRIKNSYLVL